MFRAITIRKCLLAKRWPTYSKMWREERKHALPGFDTTDKCIIGCWKSWNIGRAKPSIVFRSQLDNLAKMTPVEENNAWSLHELSTTVNNFVWTFQELGYDDDLRSSSNAKVAVEKPPLTLLLKWNEYVIRERIGRVNLTTLRDWLQEQFDPHDLLPTRKREKATEKRREDIIEIAAHLLRIFVPIKGRLAFCWSMPNACQVVSWRTCWSSEERSTLL